MAVAPVTSLGCARCGSCCDPVHLGADQAALVEEWRAYVAAGGSTRPGSDPAFILAHWHEIERSSSGGTRYRCDRFDPDARTCTAHEDRPDVCRDFPWYGEKPGEAGARSLDRVCSYLLDVPADQRPTGSRPLIPLEVIR